MTCCNPMRHLAVTCFLHSPVSACDCNDNAMWARMGIVHLAADWSLWVQDRIMTEKNVLHPMPPKQAAGASSSPTSSKSPFSLSGDHIVPHHTDQAAVCPLESTARSAHPPISTVKSSQIHSSAHYEVPTWNICSFSTVLWCPFSSHSACTGAGKWQTARRPCWT